MVSPQLVGGLTFPRNRLGYRSRMRRSWLPYPFAYTCSSGIAAGASASSTGFIYHHPGHGISEKNFGSANDRNHSKIQYSHTIILATFQQIKDSFSSAESKTAFLETCEARSSTPRRKSSAVERTKALMSALIKRKLLGSWRFRNF